MNFERHHRLLIRTPEGVHFSFLIASPALRGAAWLVDAFVINTTWGVLSAVVSLLGVISADLAGLATIVSFFILSLGYRMVAEWAWNGQTLGKRLFKLRVIDATGLPLTGSQVILRNLLRFVDSLPAGYVLGTLTAWFNPQGKRLGDVAANTVVVWEAARPKPALTAWSSSKYNSLREHTAVVARLRQAISPEEAHLAWRALARRDDLEDEARLHLFATLATHFRRRVPLPPELIEGISDEQWLRNLVEVLFSEARPTTAARPL